MLRRISLWLPSLTVFALSACGGSESGFFSDVPHLGSAGASAHAGSTSSSGGSNPGSAGNSSSAGAGAIDVAGNPGNPGSAGEVGSGGDGEAGESNAGAQNGGASSGGRAGASSSGGTGGNGGSHAGAGGSGATAGHAGSQAGSAGSGGTTQEPSCNDLLKQASEQLQAARACDLGGSAFQCTGTVKNTCNCQVPVQKNDSAETKAYLNTLKKIEQKNCVQVCTAQACKLVVDAACKASGSDSAGVCTVLSIGPGPGPF